MATPKKQTYTKREQEMLDHLKGLHEENERLKDQVTTLRDSVDWDKGVLKGRTTTESPAPSKPTGIAARLERLEKEYNAFAEQTVAEVKGLQAEFEVLQQRVLHCEEELNIK